MIVDPESYLYGRIAGREELAELLRATEVERQELQLFNTDLINIIKELIDMIDTNAYDLCERIEITERAEKLITKTKDV